MTIPPYGKNVETRESHLPSLADLGVREYDGCPSLHRAAGSRDRHRPSLTRGEKGGASGFPPLRRALRPFSIVS